MKKNNKNRNRVRYTFSCFLLIGLLVIPVIVRNQYVLHILINIFMVSLSVLGVRLILLSGSISLGQAGFVAIGAYTSAILVMRVGVPLWVALPLSGLMSAMIGAAIGWPALRLRGLYFIILTLCIGEAIIHYIGNLENLTGGLDGLYGIPRPSPVKIAGYTILDFNSGKAAYYYYGLALLSLCLWVMFRIDRSRLGIILNAISGNDRLAESMGVPVMRFKVLTFSIACFFSGLAGAFYAHYFVFLQNKNFTVWDSIYYLVYVIVGGARSVFGPVIGCLIMFGFFEISRPLAKFQQFTYGCIFVVIILFLPEGLVSLKDILKEPFKRFFSRTKKRAFSNEKLEIGPP